MLGNVLGGLLLASPFAPVRNLRFLKYLIALGAGFMLAAIFIEIMPETIGMWTDGRTGEAAAASVLGAMTLLLAGYLLNQSVQHVEERNTHKYDD